MLSVLLASYMPSYINCPTTAISPYIEPYAGTVLQKPEAIPKFLAVNLHTGQNVRGWYSV